MSDAELAAEWVDVETIMPWGQNPRVNDAAVPAVVASIQEFGFGTPLLVRRENRQVIAGHTRLKAALELGMKRVPVRFMDLDERKAHLLALADNRLNEKATWSEPDLLALLNSYEGSEVHLAGWSSEDLEKMASKLLVEPPDAFPAYDESIETNRCCPKCGYEWSDGK